MASGAEPARRPSPSRGMNGGARPPKTGAPAAATDLFAPLPARAAGPSRLAGLLDADPPPSPPPSPPPAAAASSPVASPPYWAQPTGPHHRGVSNVSAESILPAGAITLRDNENGEADDARGSGSGRTSACWARRVEVTDWVVVNGSATNIGAFVVWNVRVETLSGSFMNIRKRYSEFDDLRRRLVYTFPNFEAAVPGLPPKSVISKFRPRFLEKRRAGLQYFLNCILLNPEFSGSPVLKEFLFS